MTELTVRVKMQAGFGEAYQTLERTLANATPDVKDFCIGPFNPPAVGESVLCLVCAREKPWGTFDSKTGAVVCASCRDAGQKASTPA